MPNTKKYRNKKKPSCGCQSGGANNISNTKEASINNKKNSSSENTNVSKKRDIKNIKPENINSMSNEELEKLISENPDLFAGMNNSIKQFKNSKKNLETAKATKSLVVLNKNIKNSSIKISSIINHIDKEQRARTEGYYVIGINIPKILNYLFQNSKDNKLNTSNNYIKKYKQIGEYVNVNPDKINMIKPRLISKSKFLSNKISNTSTIKNILELSSDYNTNKKISPNGLLTMTRYLFLNKKDEKQWLKVVELMEIIYKNIGEFQNLSRDEFFDQKTPIELNVILELEEIFNTQHIFQEKPILNDEVYEFYSRF